MIGWVVFRSADLRSALEFFKLLFGLQPSSGTFLYYPVSSYLPRDVILYLIAACLFAWLPVERFEKQRFWQSVPGTALAGLTSLLLVAYSAIVLSTVGFNPFIYFRF
jgi:alginate O-acetyltransferase complex protein AlgI